MNARANSPLAGQSNTLISLQLEDHHPIVGWIEDPILSGDLEG